MYGMFNIIVEYTTCLISPDVLVLSRSLADDAIRERDSRFDTVKTAEDSNQMRPRTEIH